jgi:hypothetical protein
MYGSPIRSCFISMIAAYVIAIIGDIIGHNLGWQITRSFAESVIYVRNSIMKLVYYTLFKRWKSSINWPHF